jgi:pimeloyl-ACP methyl ester carboxylesterase
VILAILDVQKISSVNVIAHSEGAINAVIAAHMKPVIFKDILLVGPGGFVEHEPFIELMARYIGNLFQGGVRALKDESARARLIRSGVETLEYFLMNPVMGLLEGSAISRANLKDYLIELHGCNIPIAVVQGLDDIVFPHKKMKSLTDLNWIIFYLAKGDHNDIYACPQNLIPFIIDRFCIVDQNSLV